MCSSKFSCLTPNTPALLAAKSYIIYHFYSPSVKNLEEMKDQWDQFGAGFEAFSLWISEKEKQLDAMKSSTLPLEEQIDTVKVQ